MIIYLNKTFLKPIYPNSKATQTDTIPWSQFYREPSFIGFAAEFDWFSTDILEFTITCLERGISVRLIDRTLNINRVYQHTSYTLPRDSRQSLTEWDTTQLPLSELRTWQRDNNSYLSDLRRNQELYTALSNMKLQLQETLRKSDLLLGQLKVILNTYPERDFSTQTREDLANTFSTLWDMPHPTSGYEVEMTIIQGLYYLSQGLEPTLPHTPEELSYDTIGDYVLRSASEA